MQTSDKSQEVRIIVSSDDSWAAQTFFNNNAYPTSVHSTVDSTAAKAAMFRYQARSISNVISEERERFFKYILHEKAGLIHLYERPPHLAMRLESDGIEHLAYFNGTLYALKSFLDIYAQLMCSLISPSQQMTFRRGKVEGQELAGGKLITWLQRSCPGTFTHKTALSNTISQHSSNWITQAVKFRDQLTGVWQRFVHLGTI